MIIQHFNKNSLLIKHETVVNQDFSLNPDDAVDKKEKELFLFDNFFKNLIINNEIAVQIFEIVPKNIEMGSYFNNIKVWENQDVWNKWEQEFKTKHKMHLYFYDPYERKKEIFSGMIDSMNAKETIYSSKHMEESFEIKDYSVTESEFASSFQIDLPVDTIKECFEKSNIPECKEFLKRFQFECLNEFLPQKSINPKKKKI